MAAKPRVKRVYRVKVIVNGDVKFDDNVEVRRQSELNSVFSNHKLDIGDIAELTVERVF